MTNKLTTTASIPAGDLLLAGAQPGQVVDGGKPNSSGVQSFAGRTGAVTPEVSDYAAFYAVSNPPIEVSVNTTLTATQVINFTPVIVTAPATVTFPPTSAGLGGAVLISGGGAVTIQADSTDVITSSGTSTALGGNLSFTALGQVIWVFSDGKGHLWVGL